MAKITCYNCAYIQAVASWKLSCCMLSLPTSVEKELSISMGLPIICHDVSGVSIAVNETCGVKIPLISSKNSIKCFQDAMKLLIGYRALLEKLKIGAKKKDLLR